MLQAVTVRTTQLVVPLRQIQQLLVRDLYGVVLDARSNMSLKTVSKSEPIFPAPPPAVAHAITNKAMIAATSNINAYSVVACPRERLCE
jgi:hypothetical protein